MEETQLPSKGLLEWRTPKFISWRVTFLIVFLPALFPIRITNMKLPQLVSPTLRYRFLSHLRGTVKFYRITSSRYL